jgi:hypothetical protein
VDCLRGLQEKFVVFLLSDFTQGSTWHRQQRLPMQPKAFLYRPFDGEDKKFQLWWTRFKAYAAVKRFSQAIQRTADPNLPDTEGATIDATTANGRVQTVALERNMLAIASLTMAFQTEGLINLMGRE